MDKLQVLFQEWENLQPLKPEYQNKLNDKFSLEFNYNSNHIEGNTLTYGQTKLLFFFGETTGDAKMRDWQEMKAHNVALQWILQIAKESNRPLTETDIRNLNKIILVEDYKKINPKNNTQYEIHVGTYKTRPNSVITATGEEFHYASSEETPAMMTDLMRWFNDELQANKMPPLEIAALLHYRYIRIHPFEDGNGRIARLLITYVLERFGYPMIIIKSEQKEDYLRVLHQCDVNVGLTPFEGTHATIAQIEPFVEYLKRQLEWSLNIAIRAGKGEEVEESNDISKRITILKNKLSGQVIQKSSESVKSVIQSIIFPIALKIEKQIAELKEMFDSYYVTNALPKGSIPDIIKGGTKPLVEPKHFNDVEALESKNRFEDDIDYFNLNEYNIFFWFNGFRYNSQSLFDLRVRVGVKFQINDYEISTDISDNKLIRAYNTPIVDEEIDEFVRKTGIAVLAYIEEKTTNK